MSSKRLTIFLVTLLLIIILTFIFYNNYHITSNTLELSGISSSKYALRIYDVSDNLLSCTTYYQNPSTDQSNFVKYVVEYTFENGSAHPAKKRHSPGRRAIYWFWSGASFRYPGWGFTPVCGKKSGERKTQNLFAAGWDTGNKGLGKGREQPAGKYGCGHICYGI